MSWNARLIVVICVIACAGSGASVAEAATTRYVATVAHGGNDTGGTNTCVNRGAPCLTVQHAVNEASTGDTIEIGPGRYPEAVSALSKALTFIGAGAGTSTTFDPATESFIDASGTTNDGLNVGDHDITVENLRIRGGVGTGLVEIDPAISAAGGPTPTKFNLSDSVLLQASVANPNQADPTFAALAANVSVSLDKSVIVGFEDGVFVQEPGGSLALSGCVVLTPASAGHPLGVSTVRTDVPTTITGSQLIGYLGLDDRADSTTVLRSVIKAGNVGISLADTGNGPTLAVRDSVISPDAGTLPSGVEVGAGSSGETEVPTVDLTFDTVLARATPDAYALDTTSAFAGTHINVQNTILRAIDTSGGSGNDDIASGTAALNWNLGFTDYQNVKGVGVPAPGSGTNFDVPAHFVDDSGANLRLGPASTLFDVGDPSVVNPGETDVTGAPRALAHTCGAAPLPDIGAYEAAAPSCPPPTASITSPANGATFTLGQAVPAAYSCAAVTPASVSGCVGNVAVGQAVDTTTLGAHTFTVTATSSDGTTATATSTYTVNPPTPVLSTVKTSHKTFRDGSKLASIAKAKRHHKPPVGTAFSFKLNTDATVKLTFTQLVPGRKSGHKCVKQTKHNKHAHSCTRSKSAGTLSLTGQTGPNTITFQGRVSKTKKLKTGNYKVTLTATNAVGHSKTRSAKLTISR